MSTETPQARRLATDESADPAAVLLNEVAVHIEEARKLREIGSPQAAYGETAQALRKIEEANRLIRSTGAASFAVLAMMSLAIAVGVFFGILALLAVCGAVYLAAVLCAGMRLHVARLRVARIERKLASMRKIGGAA
jgi:hypothetical protein